MFLISQPGSLKENLPLPCVLWTFLYCTSMSQPGFLKENLLLPCVLWTFLYCTSISRVFKMPQSLGTVRLAPGRLHHPQITCRTATARRHRVLSRRGPHLT